MEKFTKWHEGFKTEYKGVSLRVSRLFFVLTELININDMYQYSLDFFVNIFANVLHDGKRQEDLSKKDKLQWYIDEFTRRLFKQVSWSLFENHKLLFAFLITLKILDEKLSANGGPGLNVAELRFMMAGSTKVQSSSPNPTGDRGWLSDKNWCAIEEMTELFPKSFPKFDKEFAKDINAWKLLYDDLTP